MPKKVQSKRASKQVGKRGRPRKQVSKLASKDLTTDLFANVYERPKYFDQLARASHGKKTQEIGRIAMQLQAMTSTQAIIYPINDFVKVFDKKINTNLSYIKTVLKQKYALTNVRTVVDTNRVVIWKNDV